MLSYNRQFVFVNFPKKEENKSTENLMKPLENAVSLCFGHAVFEKGT